MSFRFLFPDLKGFCLDQAVFQDGRFLLVLSSTRRSGRCPLCHKRSDRVHSRYRRTLTDLPLRGFPVSLQVQVRRFFCPRRRCPRKTFVESLGMLATSRARRTHRVEQVHQRIGLALGGNPGARHSAEIGLKASASTLLRQIHRLPNPETGLVRVLGVDDWAIRKGERYGTILVDLERRRVVDLLPDRTSESLAKWLQDHPGVEVISRDRAEAYAEGARLGAPQALQVADRFHLVQNLMEAVEKEVAGRMTAIRKLLLPTAPSEKDDGPVPLSRRRERIRDESRARRFERWQQVQEFRGQDYAKKEIARMTGIDVRTVRTYLKSPTFPERRLRVSPKGPLDPYKPYLQERWKEGCHNALQLWREVKQQGFVGGATAIRDFVRPWRSPGEDRILPLSSVKIPSVRSISWLLVGKGKKRSDQVEVVKKLCEVGGPLESLRQRAKSFLDLIHGRSETDLASWQKEVSESGFTHLMALSRGLDRDRAAVEAALSQPWSNGPTEGHVNRLKLIKRQMYGRAGFELLRRRVLLAP